MNLANARARFSPYANSVIHGATPLAGVFYGHDENALLEFYPRHETTPLRVVLANPIDVDHRRRLEIIEHGLFVYPLPVAFEQVSDREVIASLPEAGIAISGDDKDDALDSLIIVLRETLEDFLAEEGNLGPEPRRQLGILRARLRP